MSTSQDPPAATDSLFRPGHRMVLAALALLTVCLAGLLVLLGAGLVSGRLRVLCLFGACLIVALIVVLVPAGLRTSAGSFAAAFVAAAGILPVFFSSDDNGKASTPSEPRANPAYLAELVKQGPFTERLPRPPEDESREIRWVELRDTQIGDPSAATRLNAVQLVVNTPPDSYLWAHMEIYPSPSEAAKRKAERLAGMKENYGRLYGNCVDETGAHGAGWTCVDARGYAYAEAAVSPSDNAHIPMASGTLAALLL